LLHISPPSSNDEDNEIDVDNDEQFDYEDDLPLSSWIALNKCFELPFTENPCEDDIVNSVSEESEVIDSSEDESDTDTLRVPTNEVFKAVNTLSNFLSAQGKMCLPNFFASLRTMETFAKENTSKQKRKQIFLITFAEKCIQVYTGCPKFAEQLSEAMSTHVRKQ
jgi:hypothetical protein